MSSTAKQAKSKSTSKKKSANLSMVKSGSDMTLSKKELLTAYEDMLLLRRSEEKAANLYQQGQIGGFCHLYIGQEAVMTGCKSASQDNDDFITSYRCHAHAIACGVEPKYVLAELCGKVTGISRGKGGSMHMFDPEKHFWGGHGIVAAQTPLGTGIAFANKYNNRDSVCFTFLGDGAANQGQVFESFNMAAIWGLPVLYIVENNRYGMGTSAERIAAGELCDRGQPFGIPGKKVDGMDFVAVHEAVTEACEYIRKNQKPMILEMETYRYRGHSMSDPAKYRERSEVDEMKDQHDPINGLGNVLRKSHKISDKELKEIDTRVKATIAEAAEFALSSPEPDLSELWTDIIPE